MPFAVIEQRRAYQRAYYVARMRGLWRRYRAAGGCGECGLPVERFARCQRHRVASAARKQQARRAA